jgi:hypothetical protein
MDASPPPPAASKPAHELGKHAVWRITSAFRAVDEESRSRSGAIAVLPFLEACGTTTSLYGASFFQLPAPFAWIAYPCTALIPSPPISPPSRAEHLFGAGSFVGRLLGRTTTRHIACVKTVAAAPSTPQEATSSVQRLVVWERDTHGVEHVRRNRLSACHTTLWLNRGLCFLQTLMELSVSDSDLRHSPRACASAAYQLTLRPYHSMILAGLFRAAVSFAPEDRSTMVKSFGWEDEPTALADIRACAASMQPVTKRLGDHLRKEGLDFSDRVGSPLQQHK